MFSFSLSLYISPERRELPDSAGVQAIVSSLTLSVLNSLQDDGWDTVIRTLHKTFSTEGSHPSLLSVDIQTLRRALHSFKRATTAERIAAPDLDLSLANLFHYHSAERRFA